jgi:hypothetical protein
LFFRGKALSLSSFFAQTGPVGIHGIKLRILICGLQAAIVFLGLIIAIRPVPASVQITSLGFTNIPPVPHVSYASFCISNTGKCSMHGLAVYGFERKGWPPNSSKFQVEHPVAISELKPGEFKTISFSELPQTGPWRLVLPLAKIDWRYQLQQKRFRFMRKLPRQIWIRLSPRYQEYYSDWITPIESEPTPSSATKSPSDQ